MNSIEQSILLIFILLLFNFLLFIYCNISTKKFYWCIFPIALIIIPCTQNLFKFIHLKIKLKQEEKHLITEIPALIDSILSYLKAGIHISEAIFLVAKKNHWSPTIKRNLFVISSSYQQGLSFQEALKKAMDLKSTARYIKHIQYILSAIQLGHQSGSKISSILENAKAKTLSSILIEQKIKVLTAQMKFQSSIISFIPAILFIIIYIISPEHILFFIDNFVGNILLVICCIFNVIGILILKRITQID